MGGAFPERRERGGDFFLRNGGGRTFMLQSGPVLRPYFRECSSLTADRSRSELELGDDREVVAERPSLLRVYRLTAKAAEGGAREHPVVLPRKVVFRIRANTLSLVHQSQTV